MSPCVMQYEVRCITYDKFLPKMFNLKLIETLALIFSLQEIQGIQEQVKYYYEDTDKCRGRVSKTQNSPILFKKSVLLGKNVSDVEKREKIFPKVLLTTDLLLEVPNKGSL